MLIGFTGLPGAGKSTAAKHLKDRHGFVHINVGDPIKAMLEGLYRWCGLSDEEIERRLYGDLKREPDPLLNGRSPTHALQTLGFEWRNTVAPTVFVDRWADQVRRCSDAVSDGMRHPDEMPVFRELGGLLVRIDRPGVIETTGHVAEALRLDPDVVIVNNGSVEQLCAKVDGLLADGSFPLRKVIRAV